MRLREHSFIMDSRFGNMLWMLRETEDMCGKYGIPVRFAVTKSEQMGFPFSGFNYHCEAGFVEYDEDEGGCTPPSNLLNFRKRTAEETDKFNIALIIPTGIGSELGGHAGDANALAKYMASMCDTLITHPNVVNASDINEMTENTLYVEGSILTRLLMGTIGLQKVRSNRVMVIIDKHKDPRIEDITINSIEAARATLGLHVTRIVRIDPPAKMKAFYSESGTAQGSVEHLERIYNVMEEYKGEYDAVAIACVTELEPDAYKNYVLAKGEIINPWGGAEAMLTHTLSGIFDVPTAHAPMIEKMEDLNNFFGQVDPRIASEEVSISFFHCVLKGLSRAPRIVDNDAIDNHLSAENISCVVMPDGCLGLPTLAAVKQGIPLILVKNKNTMRNDLDNILPANAKVYRAENYLEAAGIVNAIKSGVTCESVTRPIHNMKVEESNHDD